MNTPHSPAPSAATGEPADTCVACHSDAPLVATSAGADLIGGGARFSVPTMDCASEESEIRRAVEHITGIRAMTFQLGQRTIAIDAPLGMVFKTGAAKLGERMNLAT